jgi:hypothetical protein
MSVSAASQAGPPGRRRMGAPEAEYDIPTRAPRLESRKTATIVQWLMVALWIIGSLGAATSVVAVDAPDAIQRPSAALLMLVFAVVVVHRAGGHMRIWMPIVSVLGLAAVVAQTNVLIAASAVVSAVLSAVSALLVTRAAPSAMAAIGEYALAIVVALTGTLSVAAWNAPVQYQRFNLVVVTLAMVLAIALVWNLGAGLHGLNSQNMWILAGLAASLIILLLYSSVVRQYGSQTVVNFVSDSVIWMRQNIQGVPRPVEVFIGFPALIVGVSMRARRREGWWVLVFAVIGTSVMTTSLVTPGAFPSYVGRSTLYSVLLGLAVGLAVRHVLLRERSARAARALEPVERVEPGRFAALK